ncbi:NAD(P)-dependent alcohol dehydrogenase [Mucilaginibacter paludis]|uniref:Alcohol dehydrogenase zinc-binding domain protein n=1 Tax=Mucilaginibacter paludis DSM 18603 TaxID=714943 RepID=H1Y128_9SPHI|nr:NAD(P)-dependent alcohol dehydrogenase [Mucilaginibacter paludis]EHQ29663.1 Alcohol dehydrogenase zinc-binding domain protein [Mucilaginibacter paludis DSM 18603]
MKKLIYSKFGGPEVLQIAEVPIPTVQETTVLIKVKAVAINPLDWKIRNGEMKLMSGSKFPKGIGIDFSGVVEEVGTATTKYNKGDEVFGILDVFKGGALSEYISVEEKDIAIKPQNISFEQAAAMPVVGAAALQIFNTLVRLKKGDEILINGASGGIGMFATQIAKTKGAVVTTVVGDSGIQAVKDWGADFVVNYQNEDILKGNKQYDIVIDLSGKMPFSEAKIIMKHSSAYIHTAPGPKEIVVSFFINLFSSKKYKLLMLKPSPEYMAELTGYAEQGMAIVVSRVYPFYSFNKAYTEVPKGKFIGKAVITMGDLV